jgi:carotenoid cleavage dioxygenase-like enzyme
MRDIAEGKSLAGAPPARDGHTFRFVLPMADNATCGQGQGNGQGHVLATQLVALDEAGLDYTGELLSINEKWRGKEYQFAYGFTGFAGQDAQDVSRGGYKDWAIVKFDQRAAALAAGGGGEWEGEGGADTGADTSAGASALVWREEGCYPSEVTFIPDPLGMAEDDGTLLTIVYDGGRHESFLLGLDARSLSETFRAYTGARIPISFHGNFFPRE